MKITVKKMIEELKKYDLNMDIIIYDDVGKGVRENLNVKYPTSFCKSKVVFSLCKFPIEEDRGKSRFDNKYTRKECLIIS